MKTRIAGVALLAALVLPSAAHAQPTGATRPRTLSEDLQLFSQVLNQIRVNHPDSLDAHRVMMSAIQGLVSATDPHSYVIPATRLSADRLAQLRAGRLMEVPIEFQYVGSVPVVAAVAPGTRAAREDILQGDVLIAVDGRPVLAESAMELSAFLAGPRGSTVNLRFERERTDGTRVELDRPVRRERGDEESAVPVAIMLDGQTGYLRVTTFSNERVFEDLRAAVSRLESAGMRRLLLDLRDNGGGIVSEASSIASLFLPTGATVYMSEGRKAEVRDSVVVRGGLFRRDRAYPLVVMVNEGTASASELLSGALQDHDRALIVGRPTFGKALLMQGFPLSDGSLMMLVIGHVKTPCGRIVQRQYRGIRQADYYRLARAQRDTAGRPTCRTAGGRTVYGGGGIYPDVLMPEEEPTPSWLARLSEQGIVTRWVGAYLTEQAAAFTTADALAANPRLPAGGLAGFRAFAAQQGQTLPQSADADRALERMLLPALAGARWGAAGFYRVTAALDPQIAAAAAEFGRAGQILNAAPSP
ncbi:MAG TPA: S41 family peptidase [Longimicrobium sp.]|uniref:S41 family peptidase n=1 Tax=Longimicrobium sp. TaxID=2029185 RepID=UPI002ED8F291